MFVVVAADVVDATKGVDDTLFNIIQKYINSGSMCDDIVTEFMTLLLFPASSVERRYLHCTSTCKGRTLDDCFVV